MNNISNHIVDVVFISNATTKNLKIVTQNAIDTCIRGAKGILINCIVIESVKDISYNNAITYNLDIPFNYNAYLNFGARKGAGKYIMCCNNDLVFTPNWLINLLKEDYPIVSPISPRDIRQRKITLNEKGYICGRNLSGWAFMIKRSLWEQIGGFDEDFDFWFADNSLIGQLKNINIPPMLVVSSIVNHLGSVTLNRLPPVQKQNLMWAKLELYNKKYNDNLFITNENYLKWKKSQLQ